MKALTERLEKEKENFAQFKENVRKQFEERQTKVGEQVTNNVKVAKA